MTPANLIKIFYSIDEFCKFLAPEPKKRSIGVLGKRSRNRPYRLSDSEVMTILILFHDCHFRDLKSFYLGYVCQIEHTRHRSINNFATNLLAGLITYNMLPKKPEMNIDIIDDSKLVP